MVRRAVAAHVDMIFHMNVPRELDIVGDDAMASHVAIVGDVYAD